MDWLEITVYTQSANLDELVGHLEELNIDGLVINDEASMREFLKTHPSLWDYVGDEVFDSIRAGSSVQFYLEESGEGQHQLDTCRKALPDETFEVKHVRDEDWLNNWRAFFKPIEIGSRLLIVPEWERAPTTDRIILRIEPGQVFGTGLHASTRMCLVELENFRAGKVLDLGCGTGILSVGALLFGAHEAVCCDKAADAEAVCYENVRLNGIDRSRIKAFTCDILNENELLQITDGDRYDIVFANIIADVIIPLAGQVQNLLTPDGVFICSGIIDGCQDAVRYALAESGLEVVHTRRTEDWHMFVSRRIV